MASIEIEERFAIYEEALKIIQELDSDFFPLWYNNSGFCLLFDSIARQLGFVKDGDGMKYYSIINYPEIMKYCPFIIFYSAGRRYWFPSLLKSEGRQKRIEILKKVLLCVKINTLV